MAVRRPVLFGLTKKGLSLHLDMEKAFAEIGLTEATEEALGRRVVQIWLDRGLEVDNARMGVLGTLFEQPQSRAQIVRTLARGGFASRTTSDKVEHAIEDLLSAGLISENPTELA